MGTERSQIDRDAVALPSRLLGREPELRRLAALVDGIHESGGAVVIRGEAGIGKSALVAAAAARARERGLFVFQSTGVESETRLPFAGLHAALRPFLGELGRLPPTQRAALEMAFGLTPRDPTPDMFMIGLAALGLVTEMATEAPLLLIVEDAQWIDHSSTTVLGFLARRLELEPVLVLFAVRAGAMSDLNDAGLPELDVAGLDEVAAAHLLDERAADLPTDLKQRILTDADGNPLALIELPILARSLSLEARPTWLDFLPLTARLERAFAGRMDELDADARALLLVAALEDGDSTELVQAAERLRAKPVEPTTWNAIAAAELGTVDADGFHFRHPLIRSAITQSTGVEERRSAHSALAAVLAGQPDRAVWHDAAGASGPDETIASDLSDAAERARRRGARDVAVTALERSAELTSDRELRALRLWQAALLGWELGRQDSERLFREAQRLGLPPFEDAEASFHLEAFAGTMASGIGTVQAFTRLADDLLGTGDGGKALEALVTASVRAYWGKLDDETQTSASAVARRIDVPRDDPSRLHFLAYVDPIRNGAEVIEELGHLPPSRFSDSDSLSHLGEAAAAVWADDAAVRFLRGAGDGYRAEGRLGALGASLAFEAWSHLHQGAVPPAVTSAAESERLSAETRHTLFIPAAKLAGAVAAAQRGQDGAAQALIAEAEAMLLSLEATPLLPLVALARGRVELAAGRFADGYERLSQLFDPASVAFHPFVRGTALADLVEAAKAGGGDLERVEQHLAEWKQIALDTNAPHLRVQLSYAAPLLAPDTAAEPLFEVAMASGAAGWPFYAARARLAYGAWLRRQRRLADARTPLREALDTFVGLGQEAYAARTQGELRASGETRRRMPEAWSQLTPQELQIAQLAAEGLSNKEIGGRLYLSHRTIGAHLYHVFPKLGVTSRAQLRDVLKSTTEP